MTDKTTLFRNTALVGAITGSLVLAAHAQDAPGPLDRRVTYSPYPQQTFPNRVYFGDTHLRKPTGLHGASK